MDSVYFYKDRPIFGLDVGYSSIKVVQIAQRNKKRVVVGYGVNSFDSSAIEKGVIKDPTILASALLELFKHNLVGDITTNRVAISIPSAHTFSKVITLPLISNNDLHEAVRLEAEQYIPVPLEELYLDYQVTQRHEKEMELLVVGSPKKLTDSYVNLLRLTGLEPTVMEINMTADSRIYAYANDISIPTVLIDFGSLSADISVFDQTLIVTGTVPCGGDLFTQAIAKNLNVTNDEALTIKNKFGLSMSKKQPEIIAALNPLLQQMLKEIRRMIRYYEERSAAKTKISQIVTLGGGANMPGLSEWMTNMLRVPTRLCNPWLKIDFDGLQPPHVTERSLYATAAGLALINPKGVFSHD